MKKIIFVIIEKLSFFVKKEKDRRQRKRIE